MLCPACGWNVVSYTLETRQWSCKRCKEQWTESGTRSYADRTGHRTSGQRRLKTVAAPNPKKRPAARKSKPKSSQRSGGKRKR